jgi:hypothetical protein
MQKTKCPYGERCDKANERLDDVWKFSCPKGRKPEECLKYEEWSRDVQNDSGAA